MIPHPMPEIGIQSHVCEEREGNNQHLEVMSWTFSCRVATKTPPDGGVSAATGSKLYNVDSISKPQASSNASGMYLEFLLRLAHSRRRVDRMNWSGGSLNSLVICSNEVTVGTTGPMGSGLPQFGFPRRFAIEFGFLRKKDLEWFILGRGWGIRMTRGTLHLLLFYGYFLEKSIVKRVLPVVCGGFPGQANTTVTS